MSIGLEIGLPPKQLLNTSFGIPDNNSIFLELIVSPGTLSSSFSDDPLGEKATIDFWKGGQEYTQRLNYILGEVGNIQIKQQDLPLKIYAQSEIAPNESYTNTIDTNLIIKFISSRYVGDIARGISNLSTALRQSYGEKIEQNALVKELRETFGELIKNSQNVHPLLSQIASIGAGMVTGNKFDFIKRWVGSSAKFDYSCSVKLFNPKPYDDEMHLKNIVKPLAALMGLVLPKGVSIKNANIDFGYFEPFYCNITCPGLFFIEKAMVTDLNIIKGGNSNAIAFNNRPIVVDVRMTFSSLLGIKVLDAPGQNLRRDNSLKEYLKNLASSKESNESISIQRNPTANETIQLYNTVRKNITENIKKISEQLKNLTPI